MENSADNCSRLPQDRTFGQLALPFLAPYLVYTGISSLLPAALAPALAQGLKCAAVVAVLAVCWRQYRLGPCHHRHVWLALAATPVALALWLGPLCAWRSLHGAPLATAGIDTPASFAWHVVNAVLLVSVFEELLMRAYLMEWAFQAGTSRQGRAWLDALTETLGEKPKALAAPPLILSSMVLTTLCFTLGHAPVEYVSAMLYFAFTNWLYRRTGSLWLCILIHAWTNLLIALLVRFAGLRFLWGA